MRIRCCRHTLFLSIAATSILLTTSAVSLAADTRYGFNAEWMRDANINRAAYAGEEQSDNILSVEGYAARSVRLSNQGGIVSSGGLRLRQHVEFADLNQIALTGRLAYRIQPTPGFTSPWLEVAGAFELLRHRDSSLRDGTVFSGSVSAGKYLTDRVRIGAAIGLDRRNGRDGELFDLATTRLGVNVDYRATQKVSVYGSLNWIRGDHVFTANYSPAQTALIPYSDVIVGDPAFAKAFGGAPATAYRLKARTLLYEFGVNVPIAGNQALDFGFAMFDSRADSGGGKYDGTLLRAGYLYRFD